MKSSSKSKTLAMAEMSPILPQDLVIDEIIVRLPVESVGQCRCVSKPWRSLLSSPEFVKSHLKRHVHDPEAIFFSAQNRSYPYLAALSNNGAGDLGFVLRRINFTMDKAYGPVCSCRGLVLSSLANAAIILVNPLTLEYVRLTNYHYGWNVWGLGYDSERDDYKIVSFSHCEESCLVNRVHIYSVKLKSWRRLANSPFRHGSFGYSRNVTETPMYVNGCIHWLALKFCEAANHRESIVIAAFNLAREEFEEVPLPVGVVLRRHCGLMTVDGCLALVVYSPLRFVHLWVMKDYGVQDSWIVRGRNHHREEDDEEDDEKDDDEEYEESDDDDDEDDDEEEELEGMYVLAIAGEDVIFVKGGVGIFGGRLFVTYNWRNGDWKDYVIEHINPHPFYSVSTFRPTLASPSC